MIESPPRVVFDTSVFVDVERGRMRLPSGYDAVIAAITAAELLRGVVRADAARRSGRQAVVEHVLSTLKILPFDLATARVYATVVARLDAAGTPIGVPDTMIAATALISNRGIVTLTRAISSELPACACSCPRRAAETLDESNSWAALLGQVFE